MARAEPQPTRRDDVERWAWCSLGIAVLLAVAHGGIAWQSRSLSVTAEVLHNASDIAMRLALLVGVRWSRVRSVRFPYGLYKLENVAAVAVAILVFVTAYEIAERAVTGAAADVRFAPWMVAVLVVTAIVPLVFAELELRASRRSNSPALAADAREYRTNVATTILALLGLLSQAFSVPLDRVAALLIVIAVARTGWQLLSDGMRVLLDASLEPAQLAAAWSAIEVDPAVAEVRWVSGRNAGRYRFLEAGVALRQGALAKSATVVRRIETRIFEAVPHLERVLVHHESAVDRVARVAVPLAAPSGEVSEHFGAAPCFALVTLDRSDGRIVDRRIVENPFIREEKRKGLQVAEWLIQFKIDAVLTRERLEGRGPAYAFADASVEFATTIAGRVDDAIAGYLRSLAGPPSGAEH